MSDRPERHPPRSGRSLTFVVIAALLGAVGLATAGLVARAGGDDVVLEVDDARAVTPPSTVPPRLTESPERSEGPAGSAAVDGGSITTPAPAPPSPLAATLGERSTAIPEVVPRRPQPVGLQISSIDVTRFPVRAIGLQLDGQLEIPDETEIGWYRYGATAGQPGSTVLAAHVNWNRTPGPFARLGRVEPGDTIEVTLDDGTLRRYEVTERSVFGKLELPTDRIWRTTGDESLVLITCGGDYNPEIRRYGQNIVVFAVPVG